LACQCLEKHGTVGSAGFGFSKEQYWPLARTFSVAPPNGVSGTAIALNLAIVTYSGSNNYSFWKADARLGKKAY